MRLIGGDINACIRCAVAKKAPEKTIRRGSMVGRRLNWESDEPAVFLGGKERSEEVIGTHARLGNPY